MRSKKTDFLCALGLLAVGATAMGVLKSNGTPKLKFKKGMSIKDFTKVSPAFENDLFYQSSLRPPLWEKTTRQKIDGTDCDVLLYFDRNKNLYEVRISPHGVQTDCDNPRDMIASVQKWWDGVKSKDPFQGWNKVEVRVPNYLEMVAYVCMT